MYPPYVWHFTARAIELDQSHFLLWHYSAGILRGVSLAGLRIIQADRARDAAAFALAGTSGPAHGEKREPVIGLSPFMA